MPVSFPCLIKVEAFFDIATFLKKLIECCRVISFILSLSLANVSSWMIVGVKSWRSIPWNHLELSSLLWNLRVWDKSHWWLRFCKLSVLVVRVLQRLLHHKLERCPVLNILHESWQLRFRISSWWILVKYNPTLTIRKIEAVDELTLRHGLIDCKLR